ncbi:MAG: NAD(P)/FAD-dependent oxidoreductase, partial [Phycisphaerae bacterium]
LGGDVRFECHMLDIRIEEPSGGATDSAPPLRGAGREAPAAGGGGATTGARGRVTALRVGDEWIETGPVILAIGHSARDTIRMLVQRGVRVASKPFQIGVRIEHPQALVDNWQYGTAAGHRRLAPAEYHVVAKGAAADQGDLFSFCMCPGGMILPTNESPGLIATNGASRAARAGPFANSGLVITMDPQQLGLDALAALDYQKGWEDMAFRATGGTYRVPAHRAADFLNGRPSDGALETSYPLGGRWTDVARLVPRSVVTALTRGLVSLEDKFPGFAGGAAIITAPETRASAPIRMLRDKGTRLAAGLDNLYPVGEGSGYAGGIVSAAIDGIRTADAIIQRYAPLDR